MRRVSVGIPAHNEGKNARQIVEQILASDCHKFELVEILVICDGCTDDTAEQARLVKDPRVVVHDDGKQLGKASRMNEFLRRFSGDIFVQFDADLKLKDNSTLSNLVEPFIESASVGLTFGQNEPMPPKTKIEKIGVYGALLWEKVVASVGKRGFGHRASGQIRAFSRTFADKITFPEGIGSIEDAWPFYKSIELGLLPVFVPSAVVLCRISDSLGDYLKQISRYVSAPAVLEDYFDQAVIRQYRNITVADRLRVLSSEIFSRRIFLASSYFALHVAARLYAKIKPAKSVWEVSNSTKEL